MRKGSDAVPSQPRRIGVIATSSRVAARAARGEHRTADWGQRGMRRETRAERGRKDDPLHKRETRHRRSDGDERADRGTEPGDDEQNSPGQVLLWPYPDDQVLSRRREKHIRARETGQVRATEGRPSHQPECGDGSRTDTRVAPSEINSPAHARSMRGVASGGAMYPGRAWLAKRVMSRAAAALCPR